MSKIQKDCENCGKKIRVRKADVKRGWGRFCSKSCKALEQEGRTGQYADLIKNGRGGQKGGVLSILSAGTNCGRSLWHELMLKCEQEGWDDHKLDR